MKLFRFTFPALILLGCAPDEDSPKKNEVEVPEGISMPDNTEYDFPDISVPASFFKDNVSFSDSVKGVDYQIEYVKAKDNWHAEYNRAVAMTIVNEIDRSLKGYGTEKHPDHCPVYTEVYKPVKFNAGKNYISSIFVNDSYSGGVHHNYGWYGLNYCKKENRMVWCKDVFRFKTKKDFMDFNRMVGRNLEHQLAISENSDSVAFFILDQGIEIYPELGWANGMQVASLPWDSLRPFLTKEFTLKFNGKQ